MKTDLASSIGVAIAGVVIAYLLCNLIVIGPIQESQENATVKTIDSSISIDLAEPNAEIFNYKALNPTVEVYVGNCEEYDEATGECIDINASVIEEGMIEEDTNDSNTSTESDNSTETNENSNQRNR